MKAHWAPEREEGEKPGCKPTSHTRMESKHMCKRDSSKKTAQIQALGFVCVSVCVSVCVCVGRGIPPFRET